jgi:hypothetical protein
MAEIDGFNAKYSELETKQSEPSAPVIHGVDEVELGNLAAAFGGEVVG